jgi:hypothetical protein
MGEDISHLKNVHAGRSLVFCREVQHLDRVLRHQYNQREHAARAFCAATWRRTLADSQRGRRHMYNKLRNDVQPGRSGISCYSIDQTYER